MTTCLITGANRGIGLELARHYAKSGATVLATARDPEAAADLAQLKKLHPSLEIFALDVADKASIDRLAAILAGRPIHRLVVNAGVMGARGGMADATNTAKLWADVLAVNVTGVYFTVAAFAANVATAADGRIAIISSLHTSQKRARKFQVFGWPESGRGTSVQVSTIALAA